MLECNLLTNASLPFKKPRCGKTWYYYELLVLLFGYAFMVLLILLVVKLHSIAKSINVFALVYLQLMKCMLTHIHTLLFYRVIFKLRSVPIKIYKRLFISIVQFRTVYDPQGKRRDAEINMIYSENVEVTW